jgi:hypothetical protein
MFVPSKLLCYYHSQCEKRGMKTSSLPDSFNLSMYILYIIYCIKSLEIL